MRNNYNMVPLDICCRLAQEMIQLKLVIKIMMIGYGYDPVLTDKYVLTF